MKDVFSKILPMVFLSASIIGCAGGPDEKRGQRSIDPVKWEGIWEGVIRAGGQELRIVFKINRTKTGSWEATMDSPDQGVKDIPVKNIKVEGMSIRIDIPAIGARYKGELNESELMIKGIWQQAGGDYPVDLQPVKEVTVIERPQDPHPPYPYISRDIRFKNEEDGITLAGTLTIPEFVGRHPAVVLVSGSGAQNRNEEIMNHRPFLVLADHLTRNGITVFRYDDRGAGESEGDTKTATSADLAGDAWAAVKFLMSQPEVDDSAVGLVGHSEGGLIAAMLAAEHRQIAFLVLLASPGLPGYELLLKQSAAILKASGASESRITQVQEVNRRIYDIILGEPDNEIAAEELRSFMKSIGMKKEQADAQISQLLSPWYRFFLSYDPIPTFKRVKCPVLALNGSLDVQVPADINLKAIEDALSLGGNERITIQRLPGLNHLFQHAESGLVEEYARIEETFAPEVMEIIVRWIKESVAGRS
ncbi:MAG: alpha/beta hydrolase [Spirochaetes bacterium]|nr:MAG: alpha/beta hydrolase [Spirochaetota bacterium]